MRITLQVGNEKLGIADWKELPKEGDLILLRSSDGQITETRRVNKIEDVHAGGKVVHFGGTEPTFTFNR